MRCDGHSTAVRADVRRGSLERARVVRLDRGRAWLVGAGLGAPRLWQYALNAALGGAEERLTALEDAEPAARLDGALRGAREGLHAAVDVLVERRVPDCALLVLLLQGGSLHVAVAGALRAYLGRRGQPERMTPRDQDPALGILQGTPATTSTVLDPGDLVLAGTSTAFSVSAVGRVATVLQTDPQTPPSVLASLLVEPARKAGAAAAAIALKVR
ncbi:MAG: PP2C family serine/threonine-protein phosphatase [Myxococcota bacterium]